MNERPTISCPRRADTCPAEFTTPGLLTAHLVEAHLLGASAALGEARRAFSAASATEISPAPPTPPKIAPAAVVVATERRCPSCLKLLPPSETHTICSTCRWRKRNQPETCRVCRRVEAVHGVKCKRHGGPGLSTAYQGKAAERLNAQPLNTQEGADMAKCMACGKTGHNARGCSAKGAGKGPARATKPTPAAAASPNGGGSIAERIRALREAVSAGELARVELEAIRAAMAEA